MCELNPKYLEFFERKTGVCGGEWVIKGTRVLVRTVLASLAEGAAPAEVLKDYPILTEAAIKAVIEFAAASESFKLLEYS